MKKRIWLFLAAAVFAAGCAGTGTSGKWSAGENSIYVAKDGTVKSALVYTAEQDNELYSQDELAGFINRAVADYISENGEITVDGVPRPPVTLESCSLEGGSGTAVFSYAAPEEFVTFARATGDDTHTVTALRVGTVPEDAADTAYVTPSGKSVTYEDVCKKKGAAAVLVSGGAVVYTEGKILCVSEGTSVTDAHCAQTQEGTDSCIIFKR